MLIPTIIIVAAALCLLTLRLSILVPPKRGGIPILMYHAVSQGEASPLQIPASRLERQFQYIKQHGYSTIFISDLLQKPLNSLPHKPLVLTFDDGYSSCVDNLFPLLERYKLRAVIALPIKHIGTTSAWDGTNSMPLMSLDDILSAPSSVEFILHSYAHINYRHSQIENSRNDILRALSVSKELGIPIQPILAYPYGGFPRTKNDYEQFCSMLRDAGIAAGLRIGNRINALPIADPFQINRIDIRGTDCLYYFKTKLRKGRVRLL